MVNSRRLCRIAFRCCFAALINYSLIQAVFELTWRLPLDNIDRWLTAVHFSGIAVVAATLWALTASRMLFMNSSLVLVCALSPGILIFFG